MRNQTYSDGLYHEISLRLSCYKWQWPISTDYYSEKPCCLTLNFLLTFTYRFSLADAFSIYQERKKKDLRELKCNKDLAVTMFIYIQIGSTKTARSTILKYLINYFSYVYRRKIRQNLLLNLWLCFTTSKLKADSIYMHLRDTQQELPSLKRNCRELMLKSIACKRHRVCDN